MQTALKIALIVLAVLVAVLVLMLAGNSNEGLMNIFNLGVAIIMALPFVLLVVACVVLGVILRQRRKDVESLKTAINHFRDLPNPLTTIQEFIDFMNERTGKEIGTLAFKRQVSPLFKAHTLNKQPPITRNFHTEDFEPAFWAEIEIREQLKELELRAANQASRVIENRNARLSLDLADAETVIIHKTDTVRGLRGREHELESELGGTKNSVITRLAVAEAKLEAQQPYVEHSVYMTRSRYNNQRGGQPNSGTKSDEAKNDEGKSGGNKTNEKDKGEGTKKTGT